MLQRLNTKCINDHDAESLCVTPNCHNPSPICSTQGCVSRQHHEQCLYFLAIGAFTQKFMKKQDSGAKIEDPISIFYDVIIKQLKTDQLEYQRQMEKPCSQLSEEEKHLFELFCEGPTKDILPSLVMKVSNRLTYEPQLLPNIELKNDIAAIRKQCEKSLLDVKKKWVEKKSSSNYKEHEKILHQDIRAQQLPFNPLIQVHTKNKQETQPLELINFVFSPKLCASGFISSYFQIGPQGKKTRRTAEYNATGYFSLMAPSLQINDTFKRLQFKIINIPQRATISIGAIYGVTADTNKYKYVSDIGGGAYLLGSNGKTYSHAFEAENRVQTPLKYANGETLFMEFDPHKLKVRFYKNPQQKVTLSVKKEGRNFLHPCVLMWEEGSAISIV